MSTRLCPLRSCPDHSAHLHRMQRPVGIKLGCVHPIPLSHPASFQPFFLPWTLRQLLIAAETPFGFGSEFSRMPPAKLMGMSFGQLRPCRPFLLPVLGTLCRDSSFHSSLFLPCAPPALYSGFSHPVSCSPTLQGVLLSTIFCFIPTLASDRFYGTLPTPPAISTPRSRFILGWGGLIAWQP